MISNNNPIYLGDRAKALCESLGIDPNPPSDYKTAPIGNMVNQYQTIESEQGRLVRMLEEFFCCVPTEKLQLGERFRRVEADATKPFARPTAKKQILLFDGLYSQQLCLQHPQHVFVFGDNAQRVGKGGQAIIRDEPNVLGVATKRTPGEFFVEGSVADMGTICEDLVQVEAVLSKRGRIVLPITAEGRISLGCGLAQLPYHMPTGYAFIESWFRAITKKYGTSSI